MEKQAIIQEGVTPPEDPDTLKRLNEKYAREEKLEAHATKRLADKVEESLNKSS